MLTTKQIESIIDTIIQGYQPQKIYLFGSYATGNPNENSDLDFLIVKQTKTSYYKRPAEVRRLFQKSPCAMDLVILTPEEFELTRGKKSLISYIATNQGKIMYDV
jgi:predicted nucleotidyltransferase